jgi:hypothetical protein
MEENQPETTDIYVLRSSSGSWALSSEIRDATVSTSSEVGALSTGGVLGDSETCASSSQMRRIRISATEMEELRLGGNVRRLERFSERLEELPYCSCDNCGEKYSCEVKVLRADSTPDDTRRLCEKCTSS